MIPLEYGIKGLCPKEDAMGCLQHGGNYVINCERCKEDYQDEMLRGEHMAAAVLELEAGSQVMHDAVNSPKHYTGHPSGVECIQVTEHMGFCLGNAVKYIWRADLKNDAVEDLRKAAWYIEREIEQRTKGKGA